MEVFWMVWCAQDRAPTYKHTSILSAQNEAARLFKMRPDQQYFVLEAVSVVEHAEMPVKHTPMINMPF